MTVDVVKGFVYLLVERRVGGVTAGWLGMSGIAVVLGHAFPFYAARMAGRGMAAARGLSRAAPLGDGRGRPGDRARHRREELRHRHDCWDGQRPVTAAWRGQPDEFVAMAVVIFGLLLVRRLEGVGEVIRSGVPAYRAVLYRCLFDASAEPRPGEVPGEGRLGPPSAS
jgi:hypothetical protein